MNTIQLKDFFSVCNNYEFWRTVFGVEGEFSSPILQHTWLKKARDHINAMTSLFPTGQIEFDTLKKLLGTPCGLMALKMNPDFDHNLFTYLKYYFIF